MRDLQQQVEWDRLLKLASTMPNLYVKASAPFRISEFAFPFVVRNPNYISSEICMPISRSSLNAGASVGSTARNQCSFFLFTVDARHAFMRSHVVSSMQDFKHQLICVFIC